MSLPGIVDKTDTTMDSIIARQKIGKRRSGTKPRDNSVAFRIRPVATAKPHASVPRERPRIKPRAEPFKWGQHPVIRWSESLGLGLRQTLRSIAGKVRLIPKARLAIIGASALVAIIALSTGIAAIARGPAFPLPPSGLLPPEDSVQRLLLEYVSPELAGAGEDSDPDATSLPSAPVTLEMATYRVRSGDSVATVAKRFGLFVDTIISANGISGTSALKPGVQLRIPNINGLVYKVRSADNLSSISKRFKIDATRIVDANDLGSSRLVAGKALFIPGARLPAAEIRQALGQKVAWPVRGPLSSVFGYRDDPFTGVSRFHAGIDIVVNSGTPVRAAMDGKASDSGYNANYGNYVILNHADGFQTLYGHLTSASVSVGSTVAQGSVIGISGNTGYSTGPHLHFGLFRRSHPLNPLKYLLK